MKLIRTVRLDRSDTFVFERAAEPGEWAVSGSFLFWDCDAEAMTGKQRAALRSGFLGVSSFGFSTLVEVAEASDAEREAAVETLARHLVDKLGAPDMETARNAALDELAFAASLAEPAVGTIVAMQRTIEPDGELRERFRTLTPTLEPASPTFEQGCVLPIGVAREDGDEPQIEEVDFVGMMELASSPLAEEVPPKGAEDGTTTHQSSRRLPTPSTSPREGGEKSGDTL